MTPGEKITEVCLVPKGETVRMCWGEPGSCTIVKVEIVREEKSRIIVKSVEETQVNKYTLCLRWSPSKKDRQ